MKTYNLIFAFLAVIALGCNKSEEVLEGGNTENEVKADYQLLLRDGSILSSRLLHADVDKVTPNSSNTDSFGTMPLPELAYRNGKVLGLYQSETDCSGKISLHDFNDGSTSEVTVFSDIASCDLSVIDFTHTPSTLFIAYMIEVDSKTRTFFVRAVDLNSESNDFVDIKLDYKPRQMVVANNRLFALTIDEHTTGDSGLTVIDVETNALITKMNLGLDARQLFVNAENNLIVGYDELHSVLNSKTMKFGHVNYGAGTEPKFAISSFNYFDKTGNKLFYEMATEELNAPKIPAIYDFSKNTAYLYFYENFLTNNELQFEYEIGNTTLVSYDAKNNLLLVGYQKTGKANRGGLLRLKPAPEPRFIDNTDFDGVPYDIFVE